MKILDVAIAACLPAFAITSSFAQDIPPTMILRNGLDGYEGMEDATLYSESGSNSFGGGEYIFTGATDRPAGGEVGHFRRSLIRFDLSTIPAEAEIYGAVLRLFTTDKIQGDEEPHTLHRLITGWGEGDAAPESPADPGGQGVPAEPGDATWTHSFYDTTEWSVAGGDFDTSPTASFTIGEGFSVVEIHSPQMAADLRAWRENPETNFGWILVGNETVKTAKRLYSSETTIGLKPELELFFTPPVVHGLMVR